MSGLPSKLYINTFLIHKHSGMQSIRLSVRNNVEGGGCVYTKGHRAICARKFSPPLVEVQCGILSGTFRCWDCKLLLDGRIVMKTDAAGATSVMLHSSALIKETIRRTTTQESRSLCLRVLSSVFLTVRLSRWLLSRLVVCVVSGYFC